MQVQSLCHEAPQGRKCQPTLVFLPGKSHGQRSLVGYSPWGDRQSDTTEHTHSTYVCVYVYVYNTCIYITEKTWVRSLGRKGPLEKEMVTHSSILAWKVPWTEEPSRLQLMGSQKSGT